MLPGETSEHEHCCKALAALDRILEEKPERNHDELVEAIRCLVTMRDWLIGRRRAGLGPPDLDGRLERVNAVVSVMTAGSFPVVGMHHDRLEKARELLSGLMREEPVAHARQEIDGREGTGS